MYFQTKSPSETLPDDPAYNWRDHYAYVQKLIDAYPLATQQKCVDHLSQFPDPLFELFSPIFRTEEIYLPGLIRDTDRIPDIRFYLTNFEKRLSNRHLIDAATKVAHAFSTELGLRLPDIEEEGAFSTALINLVERPNAFVQDLFNLFALSKVDDIYVFPILKSHLNDNLMKASELTYEQAAKMKNPNFIFPADSKEPPEQLVSTYLADTPFEELLLAQVPLPIPQEAYFEGQWIVAPPGAGKTKLIQFQITNLLSRNASIIVMDSQEQLIDNIAGLQSIKDRLVVIDANDIEFPVALNIFDLGMNPENLTPLEKERMLNAALETTIN